MEHLFVFSIGPVQDFIATARRCQDLWFGSWLLSDLARAAAIAVKQFGGADPLVVPGELTNDSASVANEVIAVLDADPAIVAARAKAAVASRLDEHVATFFAGIPTIKDGGYFHRDVAESQVRGLLETYWAAVPNNGKFGEARDRAKTILVHRR